MNKGIEWPDLQVTLDDRGTYRVSLKGKPPSEAITAAVAAIEDADPADLDTLYDILDPSALDALFEQKFDGTVRSGGSVSFEYAGYEVVYEAANEVEFRPVANDR